jgi:hypothetical protein
VTGISWLVRLIEVITYKDMAVKLLKNGTMPLEEPTDVTGLLTKCLKLTFPVIFSRAKSDGKIEAQKPYCLVRNQSKILVQQGFVLILEVPPSKESRT